MSSGEAWKIVFHDLWYGIGAFAPLFFGLGGMLFVIEEKRSAPYEYDPLFFVGGFVVTLYALAWQAYWVVMGWPR